MSRERVTALAFFRQLLWEHTTALQCLLHCTMDDAPDGSTPLSSISHSRMRRADGTRIS